MNPKISVDGMEAYLQEMFQEENPQVLDDELSIVFSDWLSNQSIEDLMDEAQLYCFKMTGDDEGYEDLARAFYKANFGRLSWKS